MSHTLLHSKNALVVLPTAAGKTLIFTEFLKKWERNHRKFLVVVNRTELVNQTFDRFKKVFESVSVYSAGFGEKSLDGNIIIASIQSLDNVVIDNLACVVLDEVHNFSAVDGRYGRLLESHPNAKVIGFTATPWNNNKPIYGDDKFFKKIDFKISMNSLVKDGFILPPVFKAPPHQLDISSLRTRLGEYLTEDVDKITLDLEKIKNQVMDALPRVLYRKKILWVCASINHATLLMGVLKKSGEDAAIIHSKQNEELRAIQRKRFEEGPVRHMCCVMMATEGYDYPAIDAVCFMRPTRSAVLFCQVIGRALRLSPNKTDALILDYGRVVENCGPIDDPKVVKYYTTEGLPKQAMLFDIWTCPNCLSYVQKEHRICLDCGFEKKPEPRDEVKNLTTTAAQYENPVEVLLGLDTGIFTIRDIVVSAHIGKSSKKPSIRFCYKLKERQDHNDYITQSQWGFKKFSIQSLFEKSAAWFISDGGATMAAEVIDGAPFDEIFEYLGTLKSGKNSLKFTKLPDEIELTKNTKGFYSVKHIFKT